MSKDIMLVSSVPTFMMNDLQQEYVLHDHAHILDPEAFTKVTAFVGVGSAAKVDRKLLAMFPNVKMISIFGVGYDGIDVAAAKERGIQVTHTPDVLTDDVADLAMGLILSMGRRIPQSDKFVRNGDWVSEPFTMTHKVTGTRLGVVGLGRIGQAIAKRAAAFDMTIAYTGRRAKTNAPFRYYPSATELAAVQERGIQVTHTPDVLTDDVADLAMGLILSMGRRIPQSDKFVRNGDWVSEPFTMTHKVTGTRLGVVGLGRIGQAIAKRAAAFDMTIAYTGRRAKTNAPFRYYPSATELAANSDYLVVAVPGGDDTKNMINAQVLKALGPKGIVVNIARGSVIDQTALIQALKGR